MDSLELIVVVAVAVLLTGRLSRRTGLSEPLLLLGVGVLVGLNPSFASFALSPDVVLLQVKRDTLTDLRDSGRIDDIVLRSVQEVLDVEEVRLGRP
ncbi:hypothetical protein R6V09_29020 [Streptomyces sp. W16]|uniref:hypothetical protein n=1 Tax=Streptomyces sp. W16 TaxID=3076631 RepID=UPI00295B8810|nr:hypothetical protein [Streptomyces sp. W16]MDV9174137.1 hypothetical protein [Streptomyces sp. W16]